MITFIKYNCVIRNEITPQQLPSRSVTDRELVHDSYGLYGPYELLAYLANLAALYPTTYCADEQRRTVKHIYGLLQFVGL